jgi:hypothetical protein
MNAGRPQFKSRFAKAKAHTIEKEEPVPNAIKEELSEEFLDDEHLA